MRPRKDLSSVELCNPSISGGQIESDIGGEQNVGSVHRGLKRRKGKKWVKVNFVRGFTDLMSGDDSV